LLPITAARFCQLPPPVTTDYRRQSLPTTARYRRHFLQEIQFDAGAAFADAFPPSEDTANNKPTNHEALPLPVFPAPLYYSCRSLPAQTSLLDRLMIANQPLSHSANPTAKSKQNKTKHSSSVPLDTSASHCRTLPPLPLYTAASFYPCRLLPPLIPLLPVFRSHRCQLLASPLATASFNS
jgi:hypothetical protein